MKINNQLPKGFRNGLIGIIICLLALIGLMAYWFITEPKVALGFTIQMTLGITLMVGVIKLFQFLEKKIFTYLKKKRSL